VVRRKPTEEPRRSAVEVYVYDHSHNLITIANVTLQDLRQKRGKLIYIKFDESRKVYSVTDIPVGNYILRVDAKGFEPDEREVQFGFGGSSEIFLLGKKGMPFYYRGKVKVPFEPPGDLIGAAVKPNITKNEEIELIAFARELNLERENEAESILKDNVRIFRYKPGTSEQNKRKILSHFSEHPAVLNAGPVVRFDKESASFLTNELVVKFKQDITNGEIPNIAKKYKLDFIRTIPYAGNCFLLRSGNLASYEILKICANIVRNEMVEYAEPNLYSTAVEDIAPTDFLYSQQWHLPLIGAPGAWCTLNAIDPAIAFGSPNVIITVMDSGIDSSHPDLNGTVSNGASKIYRLFDFVNMVPNNNSLASDHGTSCAGVATAQANNPSVILGENEGVTGAAGNCRLMGLRRSGPETMYSDAYIWAAGFDPSSNTSGFPMPITPGADVITSSFGYSVGMPVSGLMKDTFDFLTTYGRGGKGVLLFFSAGNANTVFNLQRPWAAYEKNFAIAASTNNDIRSGYSNFGNGIDLCAPSSNGVGITTTTISGTGNLAGHTGGNLDYVNNFGGTSSATPLTAGVAALMLSANPSLTWVEVRAILANTAVKIDAANTDPTGRWIDINGNISSDPTYIGPNYSQWYGYGRINAQAAVIASRDYAHDRDLVIRENLADTGAVPSGGAFWDSPDVWIRNLGPAVEGVAALPSTYSDLPPHQNARAGQDNWVYVRTRNIGTFNSDDFYIRAYITQWAGPEFVYPDDFIPTSRPSDPIPSPLVPGTYLIGEIRHTALAAGANDILNIRWPAALIPPETVMLGGGTVRWHPCLLVEISPHDGSTATGIHVWDNNNLAQKNITIVYMNDDNTFASAAVIGNLKNSSKYLDLMIDRSGVPPQVQIYIEVLDSKVNARLKRFIREGKPSEIDGNACCRFTFMKETDVLVDCPASQEGGKMRLVLPPHTRLEMTSVIEDKNETKYNFKFGNHRGREVLWIDSRDRTHIPIFTDGNALVPVIIGGVVGYGARLGHYEIRLIQLNPGGQSSGGLAIELRVEK
jgi:hypothetical protein